MRSKIFIGMLSLGVALLSACNEKMATNNSATSLPTGIKFIEPSFIDSTVNPADDFYMYAGGNWMKKNPIPASETRWGSFNLLEDFNKMALKGILEESSASKNSTHGSPTQMVGDLYASGMDTVSINKAGVAAIQTELDKINSITDTKSLLNEIARENINGYNPLFTLYVGPDDKEVSKNICNLYQGGLGLPDRDYYLKNDPQETEIRAKYLVHIANMLKLSGESEIDATKNASLIMQIETALAKASMDRVSMRDPYKIYNKFSVTALNAITPTIEWKEFLEKINIKK
jgi:putative endopeptidase